MSKFKNKNKHKAGNTSYLGTTAGFKPEKTYAEVEFSNTPTLIISKELQSQITTAHSKVGNVEWSGFVFFKEVQGTIKDLENFTMKAMYVHILDVGTSGYTEFTIDGRIVEAFQEFPDAKNCKTGMIHTHHDMKAFFSGTDTRELHDNAGFYPYYLSLIVNHVGQYCAKIAIVANENSSPRDIIANKSLKGLKWTLGSKESKEVLVTMNCKIVMEQDEHFLKRLDTLIDARKTYTYKTPAKYDYQVKDTRSAPDWDKDWDKQSSQLPRSSQPSLFDQTFKRPSITSIDLTRGTITSFIAKVLNGCDMEYSSTSLLYTLKQFDAKYPSDRKEFERAFIFDQIEEQLRNFAVKFYNKEINDEEYAVLMSKCFEVLELTEYRSIDASADLGDIFCLYSWENNKEEVE